MSIMKFPKLKTRTRIILTALFALGAFSFMPPVAAFFTTVFVIFISFRVDPKILGVVAILLLVSIPGLQYFEMNERAEEVAVYVYFLLVTIVVLQILNSRKESSGEWIGKNKSGTKKKIDPIAVPERITYTKGGVTYAKKMPQSLKKNREEQPPVVHEVKSKIIRDIEKEESIPPHRLAVTEMVDSDDDGIPLHLSLPERLKALSEKKRAQLQSVKPSLEDLESLHSERQAYEEQSKLGRDISREARTHNPLSDTRAIRRNDWD